MRFDGFTLRKFSAASMTDAIRSQQKKTWSTTAVPSNVLCPVSFESKLARYLCIFKLKMYLGVQTASRIRSRLWLVPKYCSKYVLNKDSWNGASGPLFCWFLCMLPACSCFSLYISRRYSPRARGIRSVLIHPIVWDPKDSLLASLDLHPYMGDQFNWQFPQFPTYDWREH